MGMNTGITIITLTVAVVVSAKVISAKGHGAGYGAATGYGVDGLAYGEGGTLGLYGKPVLGGFGRKVPANHIARKHVGFYGHGQGQANAVYGQGYGRGVYRPRTGQGLSVQEQRYGNGLYGHGAGYAGGLYGNPIYGRRFGNDENSKGSKTFVNGVFNTGIGAILN